MPEKDLENRLKKYIKIIKTSGAVIFEYDPYNDIMCLYNEEYERMHRLTDYLNYVGKTPRISPSDRTKLIDYFRQMKGGVLEVETINDEGTKCRKLLRGLPDVDENTKRTYLLGWVRDVTDERAWEQIYREKAARDSLTMLYNHSFGKEKIAEYLEHKSPYDSCGLVVVDIDYFKNVNDVYGHLFGDKVLLHFSVLLSGCCKADDIVMRAGGDEFVILFKNIGQNALVKRVNDLITAARELRFEENDYALTCSAGVCYLPENTAGYTYEQLFQNADWALYQVKERGRNGYAFCDNLRRFEENFNVERSGHPDIDARYFQNDIVATAFEIFEKTNSFEAAMKLLLEVVGIRFQLDRITVVRVDISAKTISSLYQWRTKHAPAVLESGAKFKKHDFLMLFNSCDEYGTVVLNRDNTSQYSEDGQKMLLQGDAETVLYAAMYCEGRYEGAISYTVCGQPRQWSRTKRRQLGELTKVISANLAKKQIPNAFESGSLYGNDYDYLTGLLSFARFREEVERIIVGGYADSYAMVYSDFENFKYYNQSYGYAAGDQLLKDFANYIIGTLKQTENVFFTRVVSDQFLLFFPFDWTGPNVEQRVQFINDEFIHRQMLLRPECKLRIRTGICKVTSEFESASEVIDAANFARKQVRQCWSKSVMIYDEALGEKQLQNHEIISKMDEALAKGQFKVYLQPKFSLADGTIIGAEALIRWQKEDGTILTPDVFIPLYEANGRITDLDFYVFEQVAAFFARSKKMGRRLYPISVNASILHAANEDTIRKYREILDAYEVEPSLVEIELTETATVLEYESAKRLFQQLQDMGIRTALDDFGAGYSILNMVIDIPVNTVKLDRVFISNCGSNEKGFYFLKHLIDMIKGMGYRVVCEGVETMEQAEILQKAGCESGQGYLICKPVPIEEFEEIVYGKNAR
ncbi:MAG: EAL domain-containing protein [Brotaphodocola sp.]